MLKITLKTKCWATLTTAIARLLAAKPHSADVERLISSYNQLNVPERSSLISAILFIRQNMPPLAEWNPRPAIIHWLQTKERRTDQSPSKTKQQDYFIGIFF